jgi:hypothetical protein
MLDRTSASLVDLDADVTRRLLEQSIGLRGATSEGWRKVVARHADLWTCQLALEKVLASIDQARGTRAAPGQTVLVEVDRLLTGLCVEVPEPSERDRPSLTGARGGPSRCTIEDALDRMNVDYDEVSAFLKRVADVWGVYSERLDRVGVEVSQLNERVRDGGMRPTNQLRAIEDELAEARALALEDPASFTPHSIDALDEHIARARATVDEAVRGREARIKGLADADSAVQACRSAVVACRDELQGLAEEVLVRDSSWAALDAAVDGVDALRTEYERAAQLGNDAAAASIRRRAVSLRGDLEHLASTEGVRRQRRDELRGLLGAYRAKAVAVGLAEDLAIDDMYQAARVELYSSPCDLDASEQRVAGLRGAILVRSGVPS